MSAPRLVLTDTQYVQVRAVANHCIRHVQPLGEHDCYVFMRDEAELIAAVIGRPVVPAGAVITNFNTPSALKGGGVRYHVRLAS